MLQSRPSICQVTVDIGFGRFLVFQDAQIECGPIPHLVIVVIQATAALVVRKDHSTRAPQSLPSKEDADAFAQLGKMHSKACQRTDRSRTHSRILQDDAVVNVTNVLAGCRSVGPFRTQKVKNAHGQLSKLAVFDKLAQVGKRWSRNQSETNEEQMCLDSPYSLDSGI